MQEANASSIYRQNNSRPITLQIKIIKLEILQGPLECLGDIGRSMLVIPQLKTSVKSSGFKANLAGDPDRGPISAPVLDAVANLGFVAVDVRTVDVRIPRPQGNSHGVAYIAFLREPSKISVSRNGSRHGGVPCAESKEGHLCTRVQHAMRNRHL